MRQKLIRLQNLARIQLGAEARQHALTRTQPGDEIVAKGHVLTRQKHFDDIGAAGFGEGEQERIREIVTAGNCLAQAVGAAPDLGQKNDFTEVRRVPEDRIGGHRVHIRAKRLEDVLGRQRIAHQEAGNPAAIGHGCQRQHVQRQLPEDGLFLSVMGFPAYEEFRSVQEDAASAGRRAGSRRGGRAGG